jgi:hypothetical protein
MPRRTHAPSPFTQIIQYFLTAGLQEIVVAHEAIAAILTTRMAEPVVPLAATVPGAGRPTLVPRPRRPRTVASKPAVEAAAPAAETSMAAEPAAPTSLAPLPARAPGRPRRVAAVTTAPVRRRRVAAPAAAVAEQEIPVAGEATLPAQDVDLSVDE